MHIRVSLSSSILNIKGGVVLTSNGLFLFWCQAEDVAGLLLEHDRGVRIAACKALADLGDTLARH